MQGKDNLYQTAKNISQNFFFVKSNIVAQKAPSLTYLKYRILRPVLKLYYKSYTARRKYAPWTSPASIAIFDAILDKSMKGFEYGSGKSTVYFAHKLGQVISVEHNREWYERVSQLLRKLKVQNVDYLFCPQKKEISAQAIVGTQRFYQKHQLTAEEFEVRSDYYDYFSLIEQYEDESFDFILVDGRARVECGLNALSKLKPGGIFVLDNSERKRYDLLREKLKSWPSVNTTNGLTDTTFWFKL